MDISTCNKIACWKLKLESCNFSRWDLVLRYTDLTVSRQNDSLVVKIEKIMATLSTNPWQISIFFNWKLIKMIKSQTPTPLDGNTQATETRRLRHAESVGGSIYTAPRLGMSETDTRIKVRVDLSGWCWQIVYWSRNGQLWKPTGDRQQLVEAVCYSSGGSHRSASHGRAYRYYSRLQFPA